MGNALKVGHGGNGQILVKFEQYSDLPDKIASLSLSEVKEDVAAISSEDYAFFAGGEAYSGGFVMKDSVDAYNKNLTKSRLSALSIARHGITAASVSDYVLFAGGSATSYSTDTKAVVDTYNKNLVRSTATELSHDRDQFPTATVGNYAIFAGGFWYAPNGSGRVSATTAVVDAYDGNLARSALSELSQARNRFAATTVGNYALFGGGSPEMSNFGYSTVDAYTDGLVKVTVSDLSQARCCLAVTTVGDYVLFGGGVCEGTSGDEVYFSTVDAYDKNLTRSTPTELSVARSQLTATTVGNYALFAGGKCRNADTSMIKNCSNVDSINKNLVRSSAKDLDSGDYSLSSTSLESYALFAGRVLSDSDIVEIYSIAEKSLEMSLFKGTKYKFQNMSDEITVTEDFSTVSIPSPATGYVKFNSTTIS